MMTIDPLSAVGLCASVLQFIEFVAKLIIVGHEIHKSVDGTTVQYSELEVVTQTIIGLNAQIGGLNEECQSSRSPIHNILPADREIEQLVAACGNLAEELLNALGQLKAKGSRAKWSSMAQALKSVWARGKIDVLRIRLEGMKSTMQTALLVSLRHKIGYITPELLDQLASGSALDKMKRELLVEIKRTNSRFQTQKQSEIDSTRLSAHLSRMTKQERVMYLQNLLLEHLSFPTQRDREYRIAHAHENTFEWIFQKPNYQHRWSSLQEWLQQDEEHLYWMTGKAGSGKSTLMKYVVHDPWCGKLLRTWAGNLPLVLARFYFWNSGTVNQMSQEGLLRSILHDALSQKPDLIPQVLPKRWIRSELFGCDLHPWSLTELVRAFERLVTESETFKLCLFVDGLDEFDGDLNELISIFKKAISFRNVKACLSSRPWVIFEEAFFRHPSLLLENLTFGDIVWYITTHFNENTGFRALQRRETAFASTLINNIAVKACGVFLWVTLVVKSLLSGMANYDRISDPQRRLDEIPSDLQI